MSGRRFASLTSAFLVRKGEAEPSAIVPAVQPVARPLASRESLRSVQAAAPGRPRPAVPPAAATSPFTPPGKISVAAFRAPARALPKSGGAAKKQRRLALTLSAAEFEALGIVAVKKDTTRQHLLRGAFEHYMASVARDYLERCPCLAAGTSGDSRSSVQRG